MLYQSSTGIRNIVCYRTTISNQVDLMNPQEKVDLKPTREKRANFSNLISIFTCDLTYTK